MGRTDNFSIKSKITIGDKEYVYFDIGLLEEKGFGRISKLPFSIKILLEAAVRQYDGKVITLEHIKTISGWTEGDRDDKEIPFIPSRIILQDFTGVPSVVDLAALRSTMAAANVDANKINPVIPVDLVIDHSVMVDAYGSSDALEFNNNMEFERNNERYSFLRWAQTAFSNFRVVPPATGIVHQVNLEYLATVATTKPFGDELEVFPDSLVGTDSHTTMINGIGVLGWGVGGIEAEACMLGQPLYFVAPTVVGFKLTGKLKEGVTATDLALTITELLRSKGVVGKFIEFYGRGLSNITIEDRATVANMAPEYGATMGFFPVDEETLVYLRATGREEEQISLVEKYYKVQGMFRTDTTPDPIFTTTLELDLSTVETSLAGPKRPQDRISLGNMKNNFNNLIRIPIEEGGYGLSEEKLRRNINIEHKNGRSSQIKTGAIVIAAITSCTNTSNPFVMVGAGLVAKKAVEKGLTKLEYVKTSLAPGSLIVTEYLKKSDLLNPLEELGFYIAGYGCTTCIGNSGPLRDEVSEAISENDLTVASVLSGNRNFEGRIHPLVKANYLASPMLVVVYSLAGTVDIDLLKDPIGYNKKNEPVYLQDIWPTTKEIQAIIRNTITPEMFRDKYKNLFDSNERWNSMPIPEIKQYNWNSKSTYIQEPPFFKALTLKFNDIKNISAANVLVLLGDSVTTDHISPAGSISIKSPAGEYLVHNGVMKIAFNSYGSRRGNHEVMLRGTFSNIRIRNQIVPGVEGGFTKYLPSAELMPIYNAAVKYQSDNTPLIIIAGKEYGTGSSRDWAAKGTFLLGVKAVIAESFERIHRSNLVGMGVLPLQFFQGESWKQLGIKGTEKFSIFELSNNLLPGQKATVVATREDGSQFEFYVVIRLDSMVEIEYYRNGGILPTVLKELL